MTAPISSNTQLTAMAKSASAGIAATRLPQTFDDDLLAYPAGTKRRTGLSHAASDALALASLLERARSIGRRVVVICSDAADASRLTQEVKWFAPSADVRQLPDWETLPYDVLSPQEDLVSERLETLWRLTHPKAGCDMLVASAVTAAQRLAPVAWVGANTFALKVGDEISIDHLKANLTAAGYAHVREVLAAGEFAVRGGIVDVFPMGSPRPFRLDMFDDEIDTIRWFDVDTQRSSESVEAIRLLPGHEFPSSTEALAAFRLRWRTTFHGDPKKSPVYADAGKGILAPGIEYYLPLFFEETATLADYLSEDTVVVLLGNIAETLQRFEKDTETRAKLHADDAARPALPPEAIWQPADDFFVSLQKFARFTVERTDDGSNAAMLSGPLIDRKRDDPAALLRERIDLAKASGLRVLIAAPSAGRRETIGELLRGCGLKITESENFAEYLEGRAALSLTHAPLAAGFVSRDAKTLCLTETELYASAQPRTRSRRARHQTNVEMMVRDIAELKVGNAVVHIDHGIGRYQGLKTMETPEGESEFLEIEYKNGAKLFVPVANLHLISRYAGADPASAPLHALGRGDWEKAKRKAAEEVRDTAAELLHLYALRKTRTGNAFPFSERDYQAFAEGFPFEETPDQAAAIAAVIHDMTTEKSMDRLVCGDVGFGKTEVALRAAFIAAMAGRQTAVLCPTTLLAEQHVATFRDRFADFPVTIAELSRFRTGKETAKTLEGLAEGRVDIVIGTHKLLSDKVAFKNLGLIIIDEEHRFGVRQKEQLRRLRAEVDVLTLTATPIPRTLSMSLEGIRDFSVIATAPERRLSVKTFVQAEEDGLIREAVMRELKRGGQVYFLHNEVETIENRRERLEKLLPEARIVVAHGQMSERELERVMREFYQQRFNVLLCTTIIETGIDVPSANTIIITRADKFGLAQLHQLRGRVGRSHHQAYAYLLTPPDGAFTKDAQKRLEAIQSLEELGSGFYLAMHDLEIRGAGEVLGEHQSGEIAEVGFEIYNRMLLNAVRALKRGEAIDPEAPLATTTEINLHAPALLPSAYVPDVGRRLAFYKELASAADRAAIERTVEALVDCYGKMPDAAKRLAAVHTLRLTCEKLGIRRIDAGPSATIITFTPKPSIDPMALVQVLQTRKNARMAGPERLRIDGGAEDPEVRLQQLGDLLAELSR